jgi:integrase
MHLVATGVSWPSLNQIVCALRFFYGVTLGQDTLPERIAHAREPSKLPVVLSAEEVVRFLETIPSLKSRTALTTVYAAGLRVSEVVLLKIADIDSRWRHGRNPRRTLVRRHVLETAESGCGGRVSANTESSGIASIRVFHSLRDPAAGTLLKARFGRQPMSRGG